MIQKLVQIGNSAGIIIPKSILDLLGLNTGSEVKVDTDVATKSLIIQSNKATDKLTSISPHFLKVLDNVNKEYGDALRELAQK